MGIQLWGYFWGGLCLLCCFMSCKEAGKTPQLSAQHCHSGQSSLTARTGLSEQFIEELENIEVDLTQSKQTKGMVRIEGGRFLMGSSPNSNAAQVRKDEFPAHETVLKDFWMDETEVSNAQFQAFVQATAYVTTAEKTIDIEQIKAQLPPGTELPPDLDLSPFSLVFQELPEGLPNYSPAQWWQMTKGASWQRPNGENSDLTDKMNLPTVHISWYDAFAYCKWQGKRLPTEAEWEYASKGGKGEAVYPWGDKAIEPIRGNYWQGSFPTKNTLEDGFAKLAPVKQFPSNEFGLYDMAGNVWEWCSDWYHHDYYELKVEDKISDNPAGPIDSFDPDEPSVPKKVMRGGSFLCNDSYCSGYRSAARMKSSPDTGLEHTGCRCVRD